MSVLALEISKTANAANKEMRVSHKEMFRNKMLIYTITCFLQFFTQFFQKKTARRKLILAAGCLFKSYRISPLEAITFL